MLPFNIGRFLLAARVNCGFTQDQLAQASHLHQSVVSAIENDKRLPTLPQLIRLARAVKAPLQWFLTGTTVAGNELPDISLQLQTLGIGDLAVADELVPGAFRRDEEVMALAVAGNSPSARIIEAMPAVLAWNAKNQFTLRAFAQLHDPRIKYRLGWLADIAIAIHKSTGFPGGCPHFATLEGYVSDLEPDLKSLSPHYEDALGFGGEFDRRPPVSLRWKIGYPAPLSAFRERAEQLHALRAEKMFRMSAL